MRNAFYTVPGVLLALGLAASACPGGTGNNNGDVDGGVVVQDGGFTGEGEGEGAAGEGEGEGEGGLPICDGGLCPDSGIQGTEYTGTAEDGVKCDTTTCPVGDDCCVTLNGLTSVTAACSGGTACTSLFIEHCDGAEDCGPNEECCIGTSFSSTCVAAGTCESDGSSSTVCLSTADCAANELCCGLAAGQFTLPVDMGVCAPAANGCAVQ